MTPATPERVRNRQEMSNLLSDRMAGTYERLSADQRLEADTSLLKSYLVESVLPEDLAPGKASDAASGLIAACRLGRRISTEVHRTEDDGLLTLEATVGVERRTELVVAYVDVTNPRFWTLHSMGSSGAADYLIERMVVSGPEFDHAWLPADLLEAVSGLGSFRGLNLDYDRRQIPDVDFSEPSAPVEFLKMQLWGPKAADVLRILRAQGAFPNETTLSKVKIKYWQDGADLASFTLDDVKYDGKVTARGTSFASHIALLGSVYDPYAQSIRVLERDYAIRRSHDPALRVTGQPVTFFFDPPIANLDKFCEYVFSASGPFRLWGVPVALASDYVRVEAVDLHVGRPVRCEVAPELVRLYLTDGSCGNSALRFYTNLQHHYNARIRAENGRGEHVFSF